jgi:hypothetical protein
MSPVKQVKPRRWKERWAIDFAAETIAALDAGWQLRERKEEDGER